MTKQLMLKADSVQMAILLQMQSENIIGSVREAVELLNNNQPLPEDEFDMVVGKFYGIQRVLPVLQDIAVFLLDKQPQEFIEPTLQHFNHAKQMLEEIVQQIPEFRLPETPENIVH